MIETPGTGSPNGNRPGPDAPPALEVDHVSAAYGPYRALFDISFAVPARGITALLGSNGAGKSTVARVVSGLMPSTSGTIRTGGKDMTGKAAYRIARAGVAHVPEGRGIFANLTVEENLVLVFRQRLGRKLVQDALDRAYGGFPVLGERRKQRGARCREASSGCFRWPRSWWRRPICSWPTSSHSDWLLSSSKRSMRASGGSMRAGTALLVVEQQVDRAVALAQTAVILEHGTVVYYGPAGQAKEAMEQIMASRTGGPSPR